MEGSGVTNYATDKPSYAYSTVTTEFDDALLQREIVTPTQVFLAKGASLEEANRLVMLREAKNDSVDPSCQSSDDHDDDDFSDDDEIMQRYRQQRQQQSSSVHFIQRNEWQRHVNEASLQTWVVVCLTSSDTERTGRIEQAVTEMAHTTSRMQFVFIPYQQAIEGKWPLHHLPCLFLYRHGVLQKQMMQLTHIQTMESLYELLQSTIEKLESK
jgi:hypothetical protein